MSTGQSFVLTCNSFFKDPYITSLMQLCLNVIVLHFQKFYLALSTARAHDDSFQKLLTFLKKNCSFELISKLYDAKKLNDKYIKILSNEHLKIVHCKWFKDTGNKALMDEIFRQLPNLTTVYFDRHCRDKYLESIAEFCPKVEVLDMSYSYVTDIGIGYLWEEKDDGTMPCPNLRIIFTDGTCISTESIKWLIRSLPSLEEINDMTVPLVLNTIYNEDALKRRSVQSYNLLYLNLHPIKYLPYYKDLLKICLTVCSRLKSVISYISDEEELNLFTSPSLEEVSLKTDQQISLSNFFKIKRSNLVTLDVINCIISISELAESCPKLQKLSVENATLVDDVKIDLEPFFHNLTSCNFSYIKDDNLTNKAISLLLSSPKLESIKFSSNSCILSSDAKADIIKYCENHNVKEIIFECSISDVNFIKHILISCPSLVTLRINDSYRDLPEFREIYELTKKLLNKPKLKF